VPINLLHVTGMGVDSGNFNVDSAGDRAHLAATQHSHLLS
jgi:hypothetical protein